MTADVEFGGTGDPTSPSQSAHSGAPVRTPAMSAYCATLARFTSSVQSTEQLLRNDDAGTREDTEQREQTAATRLRGIHRASAAADDGLAHCATVRAEHGLAPTRHDHAPTGATATDHLSTPSPRDGPPLGTTGQHPTPAGPDPDDGPPDDTFGFGTGYGPRPTGAGQVPAGGAATAVHADPVVHRPTQPLDEPAPGLDRLRRTGGADLGVALTALGRRSDELKLAETEFATWLVAHDERSRRVTLGAVVGAGLAGAAVMIVAGTRMSTGMTLALLIVCTLAVVAVGLGVAAARRLPRVCRGAGLTRRPDAAALVRYAARIGATALLGLAAANIAAGAF